MTRSNFILGNSPSDYLSTQNAEHRKFNASYEHDKNFRISTHNKNTKTNFINEQDGFEKIIHNKTALGPMPHKGHADTSEAKNMKSNLTNHHFILGKDDLTYKYRSSTTIGQYADQKSPEK